MRYSINGLQEALYGVIIKDGESQRITLKQALKHIAVSPCEDGNTTIEFLKKYFKSLK